MYSNLRVTLRLAKRPQDCASKPPTGVEAPPSGDRREARMRFRYAARLNHENQEPLVSRAIQRRNIPDNLGDSCYLDWFASGVPEI